VDGDTTTLSYLNASDVELATTTVDGLVSHLRWSPSGDRIVFTVGRSASGGGVLQDLFLWDLDSESSPMQITNTGAAFGATWRGTVPRWENG
jgi:Tol biopolymer transport system component